VEETIKQLCDWKKVEVMELNVQEDHVHVVVSIPPKVSITELMGILKVIDNRVDGDFESEGSD